jgi:hypothetical protein
VGCSVERSCFEGEEAKLPLRCQSIKMARSTRKVLSNVVLT